MKETIKKGIILGITFFITVFTLFVVYAAIDSTWTSPDTLEVTTGSTLSSSSWNKLLSNFNYLNSKAIKQDSTVITVSGSNVGIGTTNPGSKLEVSGNIKISGTIDGRLSRMQEAKLTVAGSCLASGATGRFITEIYSGNCTTGCKATDINSTCITGHTFWSNGMVYQYGDACNNPNFATGIGIYCCCSVVAVAYPINP